MTVRFNHIGHCVRDLERSTRFYRDLLGFTVEREIRPPDDPSARLLGLDPPLGMTAVYLARDGFVLELLHYAAPGRTKPPRVRTMDEPGLTHLSVSVDDIDVVCEQVTGFGGEVVAGSHVGSAVFVRDPDGQLIELLPMTYRRYLDEQGYS